MGHISRIELHQQEVLPAELLLGLPYWERPQYPFPARISKNGKKLFYDCPFCFGTHWHRLPSPFGPFGKLRRVVNKHSHCRVQWRLEGEGVSVWLRPG